MTDQNIEAVEQDDTDVALDELSLLKERARTMGLKFSPNIGLETLRLKVNGAVTGETEEADEETTAEAGPVMAPVAVDPALSPAAQKAALRKALMAEQMRLVRLRITCMNPSKKDLEGEIFTVANRFIGIVKKFVPYGESTDEGYHVPFCIYQQLKDRKFQQVKTKKNERRPGQIDVQSRWVNEFALEILEPLTRDELAKLAAQQMATAGLN